MSYEALLAPLDGFAAAVRALRRRRRPRRQRHRAVQGRGLSPGDAACTARAERAGAVNTLSFRRTPRSSATTPTAPAWCATSRSISAVAHRRQAHPAARCRRRGARRHRAAAGRAPGRAGHRQPHGRQGAGAGRARFPACAVAGWTSPNWPASVRPRHQRHLGRAWPVPSCRCRPALFAPGSLAYDMMYGKDDTPFLAPGRDRRARATRRRPGHAGRTGGRGLSGLARRAAGQPRRCSPNCAAQ